MIGFDEWKTRTPDDAGQGSLEEDDLSDCLATEETSVDAACTLRASFEAYHIELDLVEATKHQKDQARVGENGYWAWPLFLFFGQCRTSAVLHVGDALLEAPHWPDTWLPQRVIDGLVGALFIEAEQAKQRLAQAHEDARSQKSIDAIWYAIDRCTELTDVARRDTVVSTERSAEG